MNAKKYELSPFIKSIIVMITGSLGAQLVTFAASPFITRIYGPEAFGLMGSFIALINIFIPLAALTYPIAIVLPKKNYEAKGLARLSLIITATTTLLSLLVILVGHDFIVSIFNLELVAIYLYFIPLAILVNGLMQIMEQVLIREKLFSISAKVTFYQSLILNGGMLLAGWFYPYAIVLILLTSIKSGIKAVMMYFKLPNKELIHNNNKRIRKTNLFLLAKRYNDFPFYRAPETFVSALSQSIPILMMSIFFGAATVGFFTIGKTVLSLPAQLVGKAVGDVFYPKISEAYNEQKNISKTLIKTTTSLCLVGILPFGVVILFGPYIFEFVFGADWVVAGEYARWISLWSYFALISMPCIKTLPVLKAQKFHFLYSSFALVARICSILVGYYIFSSAFIAIILYSLVGALLNLFLILFTIFLTKRIKY